MQSADRAEIRGMLAAYERRMELRFGKVERAVADILTRDEVKESVAEALAERGPAIPTSWIVKGIGVSVGLAAIGSFVLQVVRL